MADLSPKAKGSRLKKRPAPPPPFRFGYRRQPIDWRVLHGIDIQRMVRPFLQYKRDSMAWNAMVSLMRLTPVTRLIGLHRGVMVTNVSCKVELGKTIPAC